MYYYNIIRLIQKFVNKHFHGSQDMDELQDTWIRVTTSFIYYTFVNCTTEGILLEKTNYYCLSQLLGVQWTISQVVLVYLVLEDSSPWYPRIPSMGG